MKKVPKWLKRIAKFARLNEYSMHDLIIELANGGVNDFQWKEVIQESYIILDDQYEIKYSGSQEECRLMMKHDEYAKSFYKMIPANEYLMTLL